MYWNHNSAYYPWVKKKTADCRSVLDVGCGDGSLVFFLDDGSKRITGIDTDVHCIEKASSAKSGDKSEFLCCSFEEYTSDRPFDAVVFAASIHHMDMTEALQKAKALLSDSGTLLIIGLARPSTMAEWILEVFRVIPSIVLSYFHHMKTPEELNIPTSGDLPAMKDIRSIVKKELPGAQIHYALHYRYLLEWPGRNRRKCFLDKHRV